MRFFVTFIFLLSALASCGYKERQGDFTFTCQQIGMLDGAFCESTLTEHFYLWKTEFAKAHEVILMYRSTPNSDGGSAGALPVRRAYIRSVGLDDRYLVAETNDGSWYVFELPASDADQHWPEPLGPFRLQELDAEFDDVDLPRMRSAW